MKEIIAVSNQKGGVGKSTTVNALGAGLNKKGYKVLYIDMDAQGNLSYSMGVTKAPLTTLEVLTGTASVEEAIISTPQGDLIPASPNLAGADALIKGTGAEYKLREAIEPLLGQYDYILLDTPPSLGTLTINALTASTGVVIPAQADIYSLQGIGQLAQTIEAVKRYTNPALVIKGLMITRYNPRTILSKDMVQLIEDTATQLHTNVYTTKVREAIAIKEAQASQTDIFTYAPKSNPAQDYENLLEEILQ